MPDYRRNRVSGGCYFFTVNLLDRRSQRLVANIGALRDAVRQVRSRSPFHIDAWVVLPDHIHCLWALRHQGALPRRVARWEPRTGRDGGTVVIEVAECPPERPPLDGRPSGGFPPYAVLWTKRSVRYFCAGK